MSGFMDERFLIHNEKGYDIYVKYAKDLPIIDYHCHISPREIYENRRFSNLTEVWLGGKNPDGTYFGDHYKWRLMRSCGIGEEYVTGNADPYERYLKFVSALDMSIGNPIYHWCNLELKKYFGIDIPLTSSNAKKIWEETTRQFKENDDLTVRGLIRSSKVIYVGTTDDPCDDLVWHKKIKEDESVDFTVCPSFRPDKIFALGEDWYTEYISKLAMASGIGKIDSLDDLYRSIEFRLDYFVSLGCRASDHGLEYVPHAKAGKSEVEAVFKKALEKERVSDAEKDIFITAVLSHLAALYAKRDIAMEIHYSCYRNVNRKMFGLEGPDTGYDMIFKSNRDREIADFLSDLEEKDSLPKTIIFSLDENDFRMLMSCIGAFQKGGSFGKMQLGAAWWFLDTKEGIEKQVKAFAENGVLGTFIGMLTDSRSFLSYARHDYFRRILCNILGEWIERGEYPDDEENIKKISEGICFGNAKKYFNI